MCETKECEAVIVNQGQNSSFEEDLVKDMREIITVFSARLYDARSNRAKKSIESITAVLDQV